MDILSLFSFKNWNRAYRSKEKPTKLQMRNNKTNKYKDKANKKNNVYCWIVVSRSGTEIKIIQKQLKTLPPSIYACSKQEKSLRVEQKEESVTDEDRSYQLTCEKSPRTDRILRWEFSETVPGQQTGRCGWRAIATFATPRSPNAAALQGPDEETRKCGSEEIQMIGADCCTNQEWRTRKKREFSGFGFGIERRRPANSCWHCLICGGLPASTWVDYIWAASVAVDDRKAREIMWLSEIMVNGLCFLDRANNSKACG